MIEPQRRLLQSAVLLSALLTFPSCATVSSMFSSDSGEDAGFIQVDDLLGRAERVHVDCELAGQRVSEAIESLMVLVGPEFRGDPALAYNDFVLAIESSEETERVLNEDYGPMQGSANGVFNAWHKDLEAFNSEVMRQHSEKRMSASRVRYTAIETAIDPTLPLYAEFNSALRDQALYLGNDFSADSIAVIEKELRDLSVRAKKLTTAFEAATLACQEFVRKGALRGQNSPAARKDV